MDIGLNHNGHRLAQHLEAEKLCAVLTVFVKLPIMLVLLGCGGNKVQLLSVNPTISTLSEQNHYAL
jgi:hypothetical protein